MSGRGPLSQVFSAVLAGRLSTGATQVHLEEALGAAWQAGRSAWPDVALPAESFIRHLAEHVPADASLDRLLAPEGLRAADLYLACACAQGLPRALETFERSHLRPLPAFLTRVDPSPAFHDEVLQILRQRLFMAPPGTRPKIAEYAGKGDLSSWVRTAALRTALNLLRARRRDPLAQQRDEVEDQVVSGVDPELAHLRTRYGAEFKQAFQEALAELSDEQRHLLRLYFVSGLTLEQIGRLVQAVPSTIARRLVSNREQVARGVRRRLRQRLRLSASEMEGLAALVLSQLDVSLERVLRESAG